MSDDEETLVGYLAHSFSHMRCGGSVYMDGSHNPKPSEWQAARDFVKYYVSPLLKKENRDA